MSDNFCRRCGDGHFLRNDENLDRRPDHDDTAFCNGCAQIVAEGAIEHLRQIVVRNGVTPQGVQRIEDWLKSIGFRTRQG